MLRPPKVYSTAHFRLSDNVENLILQGNADLQGYGNGLSNALYGNSGNNPDGFRSSNPTTPASQSGLSGLCPRDKNTRDISETYHEREESLRRDFLNLLPQMTNFVGCREFPISVDLLPLSALDFG